jgi:hypothetical protein
MSEVLSPSRSIAAPAVFGRRRWVDLLLLVAAGSVTAAGSWKAGAAIAAFALAAPIIERVRRPGSAARALHLVPTELAAAHDAVIRAAAPLEAEDRRRVLDLADDTVLEVAAVLGGRPARGGAQHRCVAARVAVLTSLRDELLERQHALDAAREELGVTGAGGEGPRERGGPLVLLFVALLVPFVVGWELVRVVVRVVLALWDGVALRLRGVFRFALWAGASLGPALIDAFAVVARARQRIAVAAREAAGVVRAARTQAILRSRRAWRAAR